MRAYIFLFLRVALGGDIGFGVDGVSGPRPCGVVILGRIGGLA